MNTPISIHLTPHHMSLTPALADFVSDKFAKLPRFAGDALAADIVLRRHHGTAEGKLFSASARLALPGRDLHATATHPDIYAAVTELVSKLARRSRKRKTRRERSEKNLHRSARCNRPAIQWNALARCADVSAASDVQGIFIAPPEAVSTSRDQTPKKTSLKPFGLVERSSSSNPAHAISFRYLDFLAAYGRA